jgi:hypothetical protein
MSESTTRQLFMSLLAASMDAMNASLVGAKIVEQHGFFRRRFFMKERYFMYHV